MTEDTLLPFDLPAVSRKKVTADFAGGSISSDGGLVLLRGAERRLGLAETLAGCIREWRDPARTVHTLPAMLRFRMFSIACGYEDADDCDDLRGDPLFKLAVGRAPESGRDLCSQPTMSRLEAGYGSDELEPDDDSAGTQSSDLTQRMVAAIVNESYDDLDPKNPNFGGRRFSRRPHEPCP